MHRKVAGAICVALALAVVAGCGGDKPLTKAEFVRQVNAACAARAPKSSTTSSSTRGPEGFLTQLLAQQQAIADRIEGINAPDELDGDYTTLKKAIGERVSIVEKALDAVKADPKAKLESLSKDAEGIQREIASTATSLGVKRCS